MAKNESWDVHLFIFMLHHRYSFTIVPNGNRVGFTKKNQYKKIKYRINVDTGLTSSSGKCITLFTACDKPVVFLSCNKGCKNIVSTLALKECESFYLLQVKCIIPHSYVNLPEWVYTKKHFQLPHKVTHNQFLCLGYKL